MIFLICFCGTALVVSGEPEEVHSLLGPGSAWYPGAYPCPKAGCGKHMQFAQSIPAGDLGGLDVHQLTPQEAFSALHGVGLPAERDCGEEVVRTLLLSQRVVKAEVRQVRNSNRAIVHSLTFEDGRRLYLGSSPEGAIAYRIAARGDQVEAST